MTQFEENHPQQLKEFIHQLQILVDDYHPNIYTLDGVFEGIDKIEQTIKDELAKQQSYIHVNQNK
jgi:hypothetical protein